MSEMMNLFDMIPEADPNYKRPIKSTDWKWSFKDYPPKNGLKVFSCFACGGGSTMGYKLAGCDVLGCVEIDPKMIEIYRKNHNPKYSYLMDIRDFNKIPDAELPQELFDLDILDGSPPCTTFSMAGDREDTWGKKKKFREGQKEQTLDDLSFVFIETVRKLRPKTVIMENVEGLLLGEAFDYVRRIYKDFKDAGYRVWHWLCKGEKMGVPQTRHRAIFVAIREDLGIDPQGLDMSFNYEEVLFGEAKDGIGDPARDTEAGRWLMKTIPEDKRLADAVIRHGLPEKLFTHKVFQDHYVAQTIASNGDYYRGKDKTYITKEDIRNCCTFPQDYQFDGDTVQSWQYVCGMSVPPVMMKRVVARLIEQGVYDYKLRSEP